MHILDTKHIIRAHTVLIKWPSYPNIHIFFKGNFDGYSQFYFSINFDISEDFSLVLLTDILQLKQLLYSRKISKHDEISGTKGTTNMIINIRLKDFNFQPPACLNQVLLQPTLLYFEFGFCEMGSSVTIALVLILLMVLEFASVVFIKLILS